MDPRERFQPIDEGATRSLGTAPRRFFNLGNSAPSTGIDDALQREEAEYLQEYESRNTRLPWISSVEQDQMRQLTRRYDVRQPGQIAAMFRENPGSEALFQASIPGTSEYNARRDQRTLLDAFGFRNVGYGHNQHQPVQLQPPPAQDPDLTGLTINDDTPNTGFRSYFSHHRS